MTLLIHIISGLIVAGLIIFAVAVYIRYRRGLIDKPRSSASALASSLHNEKLKTDIILNAIGDGVVLIDDQKIIRLFNPAASQITGWQSKEAIGLDYHSVLHLTDIKDVTYTDEQDPFNRAFTQAKPARDNDAILVPRAGKHTPISLSVSPLIEQNGNVAGVVGIFRDISQEQADEQRRAEFISTASHEMRTPVAAIEGYLALSLNDRVSKIDAKARGYLEKAHASTQHLGKLFQDLLTSAKAEDGRLSNHPVVVEMGAFLEKVTDDLRFSAQKKGLLMDFIVGTDNLEDGNSRVIKPLYYVYADPDRLREVITNLFDNAVKYTESGKVSIGLTGDKHIVQFYVQDTGPGIPADDVPHLFQKFYRVDSSTTRTIGGTGLGLFICAKIIELYQGRIWVESEVGKGSSFYINLPRLDTQKAARLQKAEAATISPLPSSI
jgi:two-component system, OmpR family, sensor histidine kinase VicK